MSPRITFTYTDLGQVKKSWSELHLFHRVKYTDRILPAFFMLIFLVVVVVARASWKSLFMISILNRQQTERFLT